jgi:hypothetical protein
MPIPLAEKITRKRDGKGIPGRNEKGIFFFRQPRENGIQTH